MTELWIEPFGGLAGDMFLAALLDLRDPRFTLEHLRELVARLVPGECELTLSRAMRGGIEGAHLNVQTIESADPPHRHLSHLAAMLEDADLPAEIAGQGLRVLQRLAQAEGRVHGIDPEEVHFHEIGAVDTLVDITGVLLGLQKLGITRVHSTAPLAGSGSVRCAHGEMPVPVPAVSELMRGHELLLGGGPGERLTPTAAALLVELVASFGQPARWKAESVGYGAGTRDPEQGPPNLVRAQLGSSELGASATQEAWLIEVHLDDATGEELGWCLRGLREAGALDAWSLPLQMKKDRPGTQLSALCRAEARGRLEAVIFERTPTLGVRWTRVERTECERRFESIEVAGQSISLKLRQRPDYPGRRPFDEGDVFPEYDDLVELAHSQGWSLREAERRVLDAWRAAQSS